ncbi:ribonuclease H-like YkuK family protein [Candidatus Gottesmanbacteria bacterium]|nr:ribonuclease H-like YkuK family protein [Candidatus Gottesmanbacteria bacterium]
MKDPKAKNHDIAILTNFHSPTYGEMDFNEVVSRVIKYISEDKNNHYKIIIGTDSELTNHHVADFVTAVVLHRVGFGGIYFWGRLSHNSIHSLRQRMWEEASYSLQLAQRVIEEFRKKSLLRFNLEIHVDIGENGDTREMINEIVGMIRGNGFEVKTKPNAFGASNVADRHT